MPNSTNVFYTIKMAPPRIEFEEGDDECRVKYYPESKMDVCWKPDGTIVITYDDGTIETYYPKPTVQDVVNSRFRERGEYYRIHLDGSVEHAFGGVCFYWGPEEKVEWDMNGISLDALPEPDFPDVEVTEEECNCDDCLGLSDQEEYSDYMREDRGGRFRRGRWVEECPW